jgi:hypothetical protein
MTHTLHRVGDYLEEDYVVLIMPSKGINVEGSGPKLKKYIELAIDAGAIKIGDARAGNEDLQGGRDKVLENIVDQAVVHAVFNNKEDLVKTLKAFKEADLGMSVVVSGLFEHVGTCCKEAGLKRHTINQSMGRWGNTDRLPPPEILQLNTMCGHGMVALGLIEEVINDIKAGKSSVEEGAQRLFAPCACGVFNPHRAALMLEDMINR